MIDDLLAELEADTSLETGSQFAAVTARYFASTREGAGQVSTPLTSEELAARFVEDFPLDGRPVAEIIDRLEREVLADANKYYHPMYMGHQTSAPLPIGIWMESVIGALNQSLAVWEMSPTASVIEHQIVAWLAKLAGYGAGAGGTMTSAEPKQTSQRCWRHVTLRYRMRGKRGPARIHPSSFMVNTRTTL
jgi:hypothetical protein